VSWRDIDDAIDLPWKSPEVSEGEKKWEGNQKNG